MSEQQPAAEPGSKPSADWRRHVTRTRVIAASVAGALATTLGLVGGVFDIFPGLRPDEPCARVHAAKLADATLDASVTRGESLDLLGGSKDGVPKERLEQPGKLVSVQVSATGYEHDPLELRTWVLTDVGGPVPEPELRDLFVEQWTPGGCEDGKRVRAWSPVPSKPGRYLIQIEIRPKGSREVIESARTDVFAVDAPAGAR